MEKETLRVEDLQVGFFTEKGVVKVINGVDFSLKEKEAIGILGESGSGKTILAKSILNTIPPPGQITQGSIFFKGEDLIKKSEQQLRLIRGKEIAMIPSNPHEKLNPLENIGTQIANAYLAHKKAPRKEALSFALKMLEEVRISDARRRIFAYPHELSGGMAQRVLIAMSLIHSPRLIVADQPTFGLDVTTQLQILNLLQELVSHRGSCLVMITSDIGIISHYCNKIAVLYHGRIVEDAAINEFFKGPNHPYSTLALAAASLVMDNRELLIKESEQLNLRDLPKGCYFANICEIAKTVCKEKSPSLKKLSRNHFVRCHFLERLAL